MRGFLAALLVARARRDEARQETLGAVIRELDADFEADPRFVHIRNPEANDLPRIADALSLPNGLGSMASFEQQALSLSACNDGAEPVAQAPLEAGLARSRAYQAPLFEAEVLRSIGLNNQDRVPLAEAHEIFQRCQARPYEARTGCEIALLNGDREAFDAGVAYLESIGDVLQIERYHKRWSTRRG